jgi:hypothetical protein
MIGPYDVLESIKTALTESGRLPESTSYATFELDTDGGQSNVRPPVIEITTVETIRNNPHNTNLTGYATNDQGESIGRIYEARFEMPVQIDVWTAEGGQFDPHDLGTDVRAVLYRYDETQFGRVDHTDIPYDIRLPDPANPDEPLDAIDRFEVGDGTVANDLTMTPALRRWRQSATVWFHETINTAEQYGEETPVRTVNSPADGDMTGGTDVDIVYDATPGEQSTADNYE